MSRLTKLVRQLRIPRIHPTIPLGDDVMKRMINTP
jgi:hypothetical protein